MTVDNGNIIQTLHCIVFSALDG